ncbi:hypothetical protein TNCV_981101 [Trichonephila clavipes]|uniref:Uncharacterized protein n=1 Tax=Trichonephila clavipes TaxID=2585209 RepID=A0A8X6S203_TRICX|nr:hypothetical protein TNCV_981101 [Trichonephila clavipes]
MPLSHYYPSLAYLITRFVTNRAYQRSFGMESWTAFEFSRTRGAFTATVEQNIPGHHTGLLYLNARSYRIVHLRYMESKRVRNFHLFVLFSAINDLSL